jgi:hypothetical protein
MASEASCPKPATMPSATGCALEGKFGDGVAHGRGAIESWSATKKPICDSAYHGSPDGALT